MHICGDIIHDIVVNGFMLLVFYPVWLPLGLKIKTWAQQYRHTHTK
jgi:hypothetical protein